MGDSGGAGPALWYSSLLASAEDNPAIAQMRQFAAEHPGTHDPVLVAVEAAKRSGLDLAGVFQLCERETPGGASASAVVSKVVSLGASLDPVQRDELIRRFDMDGTGGVSAADLTAAYHPFTSAIEARLKEEGDSAAAGSLTGSREGTFVVPPGQGLLETAQQPTQTPSTTGGADAATPVEGGGGASAAAPPAAAAAAAAPKLWYWPAIDELAGSKPGVYREMVDFHSKHPDTYDPVIHLLEFAKKMQWRMVDVFRAHDKDRSGGITVEELLRMDGLGDGLDSVQRSELLRRMDTSGDGQIQFREFVRGPFKPSILLEITVAADKKARAAAVLQRNYRGYRVRRELRKRKKAATVIQAAVRGHQARVRYRAMQLEAKRAGAATEPPSAPTTAAAAPPPEDTITAAAHAAELARIKAEAEAATAAEVAAARSAAATAEQQRLADLAKARSQAEEEKSRALAAKEAEYAAKLEAEIARVRAEALASVQGATQAGEEGESGRVAVVELHPQPAQEMSLAMFPPDGPPTNPSPPTARPISASPEPATPPPVSSPAPPASTTTDAADMTVAEMIARAQAAYDAARARTVPDPTPDAEQEGGPPRFDAVAEAGRLVAEHAAEAEREEQARAAAAAAAQLAAEARAIDQIAAELTAEVIRNQITGVALEAHREATREAELDAEHEAAAVPVAKARGSIAALDSSYDLAASLANKVARLSLQAGVDTSIGKVTFPPEVHEADVSPEDETEPERPGTDEGVVVPRLVLRQPTPPPPSPPPKADIRGSKTAGGGGTEGGGRAPETPQARGRPLLPRSVSPQSVELTDPPGLDEAEGRIGTALSTALSDPPDDDDRGAPLRRQPSTTTAAAAAAPTNGAKGEEETRHPGRTSGRGKPPLSLTLPEPDDGGHDPANPTSPYKYEVPLPRILPGAEGGEMDEIQTLLHQQQIIEYQIQKAMNSKRSPDPRSPQHRPPHADSRRGDRSPTVGQAFGYPSPPRASPSHGGSSLGQRWEDELEPEDQHHYARQHGHDSRAGVGHGYGGGHAQHHTHPRHPQQTSPHPHTHHHRHPPHTHERLGGHDVRSVATTSMGRYDDGHSSKFDEIQARERRRAAEQAALKKGDAQTRRAYDQARRDKAKRRHEHESKLTTIQQLEAEVRRIERGGEHTLWDTRRIVAQAQSREARVRARQQLERRQAAAMHEVAAQVIQRAYRRWIVRKDTLQRDREDEALVRNALARTKGQKVYRPLRGRESEAALALERRLSNVVEHTGAGAGLVDDDYVGRGGRGGARSGRGEDREDSSPSPELDPRARQVAAGRAAEERKKKQWLQQQRGARVPDGKAPWGSSLRQPNPRAARAKTKPPPSKKKATGHTAEPARGPPARNGGNAPARRGAADGSGPTSRADADRAFKGVAHHEAGPRTNRTSPTRVQSHSTSRSPTGDAAADASDHAHGRLRLLADPVDAPVGPLAVYERSIRDVKLKEMWREERLNSATQRELAPCTFMPEVHSLPEDWGEAPRKTVEPSVRKDRLRNSKSPTGPTAASRIPAPAAAMPALSLSQHVDWSDLPPPPPPA